MSKERKVTSVVWGAAKIEGRPALIYHYDDDTYQIGSEVFEKTSGRLVNNLLYEAKNSL